MQKSKEPINEVFGYEDESKIFGKLTVKAYHETNKRQQREWWCECECGEYTTATTTALKKGKKKSCGCLKHDGSRMKIHGDTGTRLYNEWLEMKRRGKKKKGTYKNIFVCDEWKNDYPKFKEWALENGYKDELTLDRRNTTKNYRPDNCRWVPSKVQNNNRIDTIYIECNGEDIPLSYVASKTGIPYLTLYARLNKNPEISYKKLISEQIYNKDKAKTWRMYKPNKPEEFMDFLGLHEAVKYLRINGYPRAEISNVSKGAKRKRIRYGHLWVEIE